MRTAPGNRGTKDAVPDNGSPKLSTQEVYRILRRKILEHEISPATRVNIHHISKELRVSPTPVREALRLLQGDNLLVATSNKGYATTELLEDSQVRNLFEFRLLIEPWAARMATTNSPHNPAQLLQSELDELPLDAETTRHTVATHDDRFHHAILLAAGNAKILYAYEQSHCHLHLYRLNSLDDGWQLTIAEHRAIQDAMARQDPDAAEESMRNHLHAAYLRFATRPKNNSGGAPVIDNLSVGTMPPPK